MIYFILKLISFISTLLRYISYFTYQSIQWYGPAQWQRFSFILFSLITLFPIQKIYLNTVFVLILLCVSCFTWSASLSFVFYLGSCRHPWLTGCHINSSVNIDPFLLSNFCLQTQRQTQSQIQPPPAPVPIVISSPSIKSLNKFSVVYHPELKRKLGCPSRKLSPTSTRLYHIPHRVASRGW
jgi:hypothetical protein